jgi:GT2 family glycosyltransferase
MNHCCTAGMLCTKCSRSNMYHHGSLTHFQYTLTHFYYTMREQSMTQYVMYADVKHRNLCLHVFSIIIFIYVFNFVNRYSEWIVISLNNQSEINRSLVTLVCHKRRQNGPDVPRKTEVTYHSRCRMIITLPPGQRPY